MNIDPVYSEKFESRHNAPDAVQIAEMLKAVKVKSVDELIDQTVPANIRLKKPLNLPKAQSEYEFLNGFKKLVSKNKIYKSYIGTGYYNCITPGVILRNILENPGWYTAYTPYQAEIAQGRMEALINYQTMVIDLTGMEIANASLLDESTAAAEAMIMMFNARSRASVKAGANKFFVDEDMFPQTLDVITTRSKPLGIELVSGKYTQAVFNESYFGSIVQYPAASGQVRDYKAFTNMAHTAGY